MAERKATIKLVVDDRDVKRAEASVARLKAAGGGNATDRFKAETERLKGVSSEASKAATAVEEYAASSAQAATASTGFTAALGPVGVAIAAVVAVVGAAVLGIVKLTSEILTLTNAFADVSKEVDKMSQTTGYSVETISALRSEAQAAGENFDSLRQPMVQFSKLVFDAANGSKEAAAKIRQLGLDGKEAAGNLDSAFAQTLKRIADMPPGLQKTNAAVAAFGQEGAKMIPIIDRFGGRLSEATRRADEFGTLLDSKATKAAREYNDAINELNERFKGLGYTVGKEFAPIITEWLEDFNDFLRQNKDEIKSWIETFAWAIDRSVWSIKLQIAALQDWAAAAGGDFSFQNSAIVETQLKNPSPQFRRAGAGAAASTFDFGGGGGGRRSGGGTKPKFQLSADGQALVDAAQQLGVSPLDLATIISFETSGTFSPAKRGWNKKDQQWQTGLIQFGPDEVRRYGVSTNQSFRDQLFNSVIPYLRDRSARSGGTSGMDIMALYKTINGGNPNVSALASDGNGTIASHVAKMMRDNRSSALNRFFGGSTSNVPGTEDLGKWEKTLLQAWAQKLLDAYDKFRPAPGTVAVSAPEAQIAGLSGVRPTTTPDQIEEFVKIAPETLKAMQSEVTSSGLKGVAADGALIEKILEFKKQSFDLTQMTLQTETKLVALKEIEKNQEEYIAKVSADRTADMQIRLKMAETELGVQEKLFNNPEYRQNAQDTAVLEEKVRLNQQIFDLENAIATQGANAAERYKAAWLEAIYAVREADLQAVEDQIRAQVRIADQATLHVEQVRARVLDHLAQQKSLSEALADGIISAYDKLLGKMNQSLGKIGNIPIVGDLLKFAQQQGLSKITRGLLDSILPGAGDVFDKTKNPVAAPIVDKLKTTNELLGQLVGLAGGNPGAAGGIGGILGGIGIGGGGGRIGPGGTAPWFPNAFGGGGGLVDAGTANAGGPTSIWDNIKTLFSTGKGGIFAPRKNVITGTESKTAGIIAGIGELAAVAGGIIGGRVGGVLSMAGTGASFGAMFGPWGAAIGAGVGALVGLFGGDPKRKQDKKENMPKLEAGFSEAMKQLRDLLSSVRSLNTDPDAAIAQATEIRSQIAGGFGIQFLSKKYRKQSQTLIAQKLVEADAIIAEIKQAAEISRGAADRRQRIVAEFAGGVFIDPAFRRRNGLLGGVFTGRDSLPSLLSPGELVLNPTQQHLVRANAGFDVFKGAGIPNYPNAAPTAALAGGGMAGQGLALADERPIHVTVVLQGDTFDERARQYQTSDSGRRVIIDVVKDLKKTEDL